ncbi:CD63 antigen [Harpegnathos saltator]|uniref:Tetraspanin n=1 Tax=Harpegnathos saltator TaxID=610380 RepID=E2BUA8_HARSA|nr:CD63 antigen [Harpegnathos saltator]
MALLPLGLAPKTIKYLMFAFNLLFVFCTLLIAVFVLEIIGGTMGYVMRENVTSVVKGKMLNTMAGYNSTKDIQLIWDDLQQDFDCCGTTNATDWINRYSGIPMSCCDRAVGTIGSTNCTLESPTLHSMGCLDAFAHFAEKHAGKIAGVGIGLGVIQLLGIFLSSYLAKSIKNCYQTM